MTPEEKSLLERTYKMAEENNSILRSIRRSNRFSMIMRIIYWSVIILAGFAAYYFVEPYLDVMTGLYDQTQNGVSNIESGIGTVQNAANSIKDLFQ